MILIDGPDGAGKSTLAKMLKKEGVVSEYLESPRRTMPKLPLLNATKLYIQTHGRNHHVAVDRLIFSELVYGPILRGKCEFSPRETMGMICDLMDNRSVIVFCLPEPNSLMFKIDENPDVISRITEIHKEYVNWALLCRRYPGSTVLRYQWNMDGAFNLLCQTLRRIR